MQSNGSDIVNVENGTEKSGWTVSDSMMRMHVFYEISPLKLASINYIYEFNEMKDIFNE